MTAKEHASRAHSFIHPGRQIVELRPRTARGNLSGFYGDADALIDDAIGVNALSVYWTAQQLNPAVQPTDNLSPAEKDGCTSKPLIDRYNILIVDLDPVRPKGSPATDEEHQHARTLATQIKNHFTGLGWPAPMVCSSGNGAYVLWATDLRADLSPLVRRWLHHVAATFETEQVTVDKSVWRTAQILRVPGTMNKKGTATDDRPHRMCEILELPEQSTTEREIVTAEMLLAVTPATELPDLADAVAQFDADDLLNQYKAWLDGQSVSYHVEDHHDEHSYKIIRLPVCPFKGDSDGRAWIRVHPVHGAAAGCWHEKCQGKHLRHLYSTIGGWKGDDTNPAKVDDPHRLATVHIDRWAFNGRPTTAHIGEDLYVWNKSRNVYEVASDRAMVPYITATLKDEFDRVARDEKERGGRGTPKPVKRQPVADTLNALKSLSRIDRADTPPFWLAGHNSDRHTQWDPADVIPFRNGLLHLPCYLAGGGDCFAPPNPAYFSTHCLGFDFDPNAPTPKRWLQFLQELWDDSDCHDLLHEWGGYCMTRRTDLQRYMNLLGAPRGGKGTIIYIFGRMVGGNYASSRYASLIGTFGLQPLIGRQLLILPDARQLKDRIAGDVCDLIKSITGEDTLSIDRKNRTSIEEKLACRIIIQSNELIALPESSTALQNRQLILHFTRSFAGREDFALKQKLEKELPGIANLFLTGLKRLYDNGTFTEPESSKRVKAVITDESNPIGAFVHDCCTIDPKHATPCQAMYDAYHEWASESHRHVLSQNQFGVALRQAVQSVDRTRNPVDFIVNPPGYTTTVKRPWYYAGIGIQSS